jgi:lysophospholipase L1-like esterase
MDKLVGFGASTAQGASDSQGGFLKRLEKKLANAGQPRECLNFGIGGNTTRDMVVRLDPIKPHLPCPVIIILGCNDLPRIGETNPARTSLEEYRKNLETILHFFAGPKTIFVSSFVVDLKRAGIAPETFTSYMNAALKIAASLKLLTWDLYAESLTLGGKYLSPDGIHFGDEGHEMIAERLLPMIIERT